MPAETLAGLDQVKEETSSYVRMDFINKDGVLEQPVSGTYTIHDLYSDAVIKSSVAFIASSGTYETHILSTENRILDVNQPSEIRVLTAIGYYGINDEVKNKFRWEVINLNYIP